MSKSRWEFVCHGKFKHDAWQVSHEAYIFIFWSCGGEKSEIHCHWWKPKRSNHYKFRKSFRKWKVRKRMSRRVYLLHASFNSSGQLIQNTRSGCSTMLTNNIWPVLFVLKLINKIHHFVSVVFWILLPSLCVCCLLNIITITLCLLSSDYYYHHFVSVVFWILLP